MMKRGTYLALQLKRAAKLYPAIIAITMLLVCSIVFCGMLIINHNQSNQDQQKIQIGLVGDLTNTYLEIGVHALQNMDASRFSIDFIPMDEETAMTKLEEGALAGYVRIPDDFSEAITSMKHVPVTYVTANAPTDFGSLMMLEVSSIISDLVTESQNAVYGMQILAREHGKTEGLGGKTGTFALQYVDFVLNRSDMHQLEFVGVADTLSLEQYYICGGLMFFLLLWGITCHGLLIKKDNSLEKLLYAKGMKTTSQLGCELIAYLAVTFVTFLLFAVVIGFAFQDFTWLLYVVKFLPVFFLVCAMQLFFYELFSGTISAVLFQFLFAVGTGYIAGCFYPSYFFPVSVQNFAACLPTGVGFAYLRQCMTPHFSLSSMLVVLLYGILFFVLAVLVRKHNMIRRAI